MNFGEIKTEFVARLNRRDITPTQVDSYIKRSIQRIQRLLKVPASETLATYVVGADYTGVPIPHDYLRLVSISTQHGELVRSDLSTVLAASRHPGIPKVFARTGYGWLLGPHPQENDTIDVVYLADFGTLNAAEDSNWLTDQAPDVIINGALRAACLTYVDPRADAFESEFITGIADLNLQASDDELTNSSVSAAYSLDF